MTLRYSNLTKPGSLKCADEWWFHGIDYLKSTPLWETLSSSGRATYFHDKGLFQDYAQCTLYIIVQGSKKVNMSAYRIPNEENVAVHVQAHLGPVTNSCHQLKVTTYLLIHKVATKED